MDLGNDIVGKDHGNTLHEQLRKPVSCDMLLENVPAPSVDARLEIRSLAKAVPYRMLNVQI
jgi:hypothetical protein